MKFPPRFLCGCVGLMLVMALTVPALGQTKVGDAEAYTAISAAQPNLNELKLAVDVDATQPGLSAIGSSVVLDETGALVSGMAPATVNVAAGIGGGNDDELVNGPVRHTPPGGNIDGLNTIATFGGAFAAQAGAS